MIVLSSLGTNGFEALRNGLSGVRPKTMADQPQQRTWLRALAEAAKLQHLELPPFDQYGMGALRSATTAGGRFVTLKRLLRPAAKAKGHGVEWALWHEPDEVPVLVVVFRDSLEPEQESVAVTLALLKGWLVDQWIPEVMDQNILKTKGRIYGYQ